MRTHQGGLLHAVLSKSLLLLQRDSRHLRGEKRKSGVDFCNLRAELTAAFTNFTQSECRLSGVSFFSIHCPHRKQTHLNADNITREVRGNICAQVTLLCVGTANAKKETALHSA